MREHPISGFLLFFRGRLNKSRHGGEWKEKDIPWLRPRESFFPMKGKERA